MGIREFIEKSDDLLNKRQPSKPIIKNLEEDCNKKLGKINKNLQQCVDMFNIMINEIGNLLIREFPNDMSIKMYYGVLDNIIKLKPLEPISLFIVHVYGNKNNYKKEILNGNDSFFMKDDHKNVIGNDSDKIMALFQFKSFWNKLSNECKEYIKNVMKTLIQICDQYIISKDDGNKIVKILEKVNIILT